MLRLARHERRGSELDTHERPESDLHVDWRQFNSDLASSRLKYTDELRKIVQVYGEEEIDLRPYMILNPVTCVTTDSLQKILDLYRFFHIKTLWVLSPVDSSLQGVISRKDLFKYMSL